MSVRIDTLIKELKKKMPRANIVRGSEITWMTADRLRTGSLGLDIATNGGIPRAMIVQFVGEEGAGKSTMALKVAAEVQNRYGENAAIAWIAVESFDKKWANQCGVAVPFSPEELKLMSEEDRATFGDVQEVGTFVLAQPVTGEDAFQLTLEFMKSGEFQLVIVDSVAAMVPMAEYEGEMEDNTMGQGPRMNNKFLRKAASVFNTPLNDDRGPNKTAVILINQVREQIGVYGHPDPQPPGGRGLRHFSRMVVRFKRGPLIKVKGEGDEEDKKQLVGKRTLVRIDKTNVGPPFREAEFDFYFQPFGAFYPGDIDTAQELRIWGTRAGIITQTGNTTYELDGQKFRGKDALESYLRENQDRADEHARLTLQASTSGG